MAPNDGADYTVLRRPRWIAGHLIALGAVIVFVNLGFWQLGRHDDRQTLDARLRERIAAAPLSIEAALALDLDELELRRVDADGVFSPSSEVIVQARTHQGLSGHYVVTPLLLANGTAILVNRGWVPIDVTGPPVIGAEPPPGTVSIVGVARRSEVRGSVGPADPATGTLQRISRIDIDRLAPQIAAPVAPFYLQLLEPAGPNDFPLVLEEPEPGGGPPHLSYAVQWFAFAGVVTIGYPLLLRSTIRQT